MKIFRKEKLENGCRHIYFCGVKIFSYKKNLSVNINMFISDIYINTKVLILVQI